MFHRARLLSLLLALPFISIAEAAETPATLKVQKLKIRFSKTTAGADRADSVKLAATFPTYLVPEGFDHQTGFIELSIGGVRIATLPRTDGRGSWKRKSPWKQVFRMRKTKEERDSLKLLLDTKAGKLAVAAKGLDLGEVFAGGAKDVTISLALDVALFAATLDLKAGSRSFSYRARKGEFHFDPWVPPGGEPDPMFRILHTAFWSGPENPGTRVIRGAAEYEQFWLERYPLPAPGMGDPVEGPPPVDFDREIVVIVDLGMKLHGGFTVSVYGAAEEGEDGLRVDWRETQPGNCRHHQALNSPWIMAAVKRREGTVRFNGSVLVLDCAIPGPPSSYP
jgi:hypothetical protein